MKQRNSRAWVLFVVASGSALLLASVAQAAGFGGYVYYGNGDGEVEPFGFREYDYDSDKFGVGFAFDTNVSRDLLFNYRLTAGYEFVDRELEVGRSWNSNGVSINNTFGFGLFRSERLRVYLGPAVRLNVARIDDKVRSADFDVVEFGIGAGPEAGVNLHLGERLSASLSLSYQYMYIAEAVDDKDDVIRKSDETSEGNEHLLTVGLTFFFRTSSDTY
ncbi:MAG: hypothetical protein GY944_04365 [bacterium]|nr:hypothetical protein [bacterium]